MRSWKDKKLVDLDMKKLWKNGATYLVLFLAVGAMTFFGVCDPSGNQSVLPGGEAASVDGHEVTSGDFRRAYRNIYSRYQTQLKDRFDPKALQLSKRVLEQVVDQQILYVESMRSGVSAKEFEVADLIFEAEAFKDNDGRFDANLLKNYLRNAGYTEKSFEDEVRKDITTRKLREFLVDTSFSSKNASRWQYKLSETKLDIDYIKIDKSKVKVEVSEDQVAGYLKDEKNLKVVESYYKNNPSEFNKPKKVHALHILSGFKGARDASGEAAKRSKEDAKKRAEGILAQVKSSKVAFKELAKQKSDEASAKLKSGDLGFILFEDMPKAFSEAAFKLKKGEVSSVVETAFGFHVIKVVGIEEAVKTSLEAAKSMIARKNLTKSETPLAAVQKANTILAKVKSGDASLAQSLKEVGAKWESTGEFSLDARYITGLGSDAKIKEAALSLSKPGEVFDRIVEVSGNHYILKLKSLKKADESKLNDETLTEMRENSRFMDAYTSFTVLTKAIQDEYKEKGLVSVNPEFRDLDVVESPPGS